ncbi:unnamed protein product [Soboliphyme baturini]|uniref:ClpB_D2-small domain-containing protein n=1 Tax=Soboliphyme baturini TaxID=241478 RepID=A0A183IPF4_9BILA|nr:unnamed protein product [Soboliphyme baturini]
MTSNLAAEEIADHAVNLRQEALRINRGKINGSIDEVNILENVNISKNFQENVVQPILKRDEFLGRITEMVYFLPFTRPELLQLVTKELEFWKRTAKEKHKIDLEWDNDVLDYLADGYNIRYGARSIKHEVEKRVVNKLAAAHERSLISDGCKVRLHIKASQNQDEQKDKATANRSGYVIELEIVEQPKEKERSKILGIPLPEKFLQSVRSL